MKKLGNGLIKLFCIFIFLLILATIGILLYPKYGEDLGLEDKLQKLVSEEETIVEENTTTTEETTEEHWQPKETLPVETDPNALSREQQKEIHKAFENIIATMVFNSEDVFFYEIKNINDRDYYAFHILDGEGNSFEYLLLSDVITKKLYWCDGNNQLGDARSTDVLYNSNKEGNKEVSYADEDYQAVFEGYMKALLESKDLELASTYRDTSYYYQIRMNEKDRKKNIEDAATIQETLINKIRDCEKRKEEGQILSYDVKYKNLGVEELEDDQGASWMDINIEVVISEEKKREIDEESLNYIVSLRRYPYGWRVATIVAE